MKKITKNALAIGVFVVVMGVVFLISRSVTEKETPIIEDKSVQENTSIPYSFRGLPSPENEEFLATHIYLTEFQQINLHYVLNREAKITRSKKVLDKRSFPKLIDEFIRGGYIHYSQRHSGLGVNERKINEYEQDIIITDKGELEAWGSEANKFYLTEIAIKYRYNKQTGHIYISLETLNEPRCLTYDEVSEAVRECNGEEK